MSKLGYSQRIKQRIVDLEAMIASAQSELDELRIAERVLGRLGAVVEEKGPDDGQSRTSTTSGGTVADRAVEALTRFGTLDTPSILSYLQMTWRPDLKHTTLASTLSRIKAEGKIRSVDGKWYVVNDEKESPEGDSQSISEDVDASDTDGDAIQSLV